MAEIDGRDGLRLWYIMENVLFASLYEMFPFRLALVWCSLLISLHAICTSRILFFSIQQHGVYWHPRNIDSLETSNQSVQQYSLHEIRSILGPMLIYLTEFNKCSWYMYLFKTNKCLVDYHGSIKTHWGLVMSYGDRQPGQYWLR